MSSFHFFQQLERNSSVSADPVRMYIGNHTLSDEEVFEILHKKSEMFKDIYRMQDLVETKSISLLDDKEREGSATTECLAGNAVSES